MSDPAYTPLSCSVHDELEALAVRHERVRLVFRDPAGAERHVEGTIADIWSEAGAEYLRTDDGTTVRLDRLVEVVSDGARISP
jgi:transcriptional antiterminator Rof (Rho-off)